jgi:hypothetical protein
LQEPPDWVAAAGRALPLKPHEAVSLKPPSLP